MEVSFLGMGPDTGKQLNNNVVFVNLFLFITFTKAMLCRGAKVLEIFTQSIRDMKWNRLMKNFIPL